MKKHHHLKRVLHPNRYFIWALIIVIFGGVFLTLHIITQGYETQSETAFPELKTKKTYRNEAENYTIRYPRDWQIDSEENGVVTFVDPHDTTESISIETADLSAERIIRRSINITDEVPSYTKENMTITLLEGTTANKSNIQAAIVKTQKELFYIHGNSDSFESFVNNFRTLSR